MIYSVEEIELTLKLYSIAKLHIKELENNLYLKQNKECKKYFYYQHIVNVVDSWFEILFPDEVELLMMRIYSKKTFDFISIQLGYANHSSVIRKYKQIILKIKKNSEFNLYVWFYWKN